MGCLKLHSDYFTELDKNSFKYCLTSYKSGSEERSDYLYGFNGYERDNEVKGDGNHLSFADYGYDTRTGRRWNVDPLTRRFAFRTGYQYAGNNPVWKIDVNGERDVIYTIMYDENGYRTKIAVENYDLKQGVERSVVGQYVHDKYVELKLWWKDAPMKDVLSFTDVDDVSVLVLDQHIDGEEATGWAKALAAAPIVSQKATKIIVKKIEYLKYLKANGFTSRVANAIVNRGNLRGALKITDALKEAHHLIPVEALRNSKVVQSAVDAGFNFNSATNGIPIDKALHGSHSAYNDYVNKRLTQWAKNNKEYSGTDARKFIQNELIPSLEKHVNKAEGNGEKLNDYFKKLNE